MHLSPREQEKLLIVAARAGRKLKGEELLITGLAASRLRYELDRALWQGRDHLYLPRLRDDTVLVQAIESGVAQLTWAGETFAYAEGWEEASGRYRGLVYGQHVRVVFDGSSVLVEPEAALRQIEADRLKQEEAERARAARQGQAGGATYTPAPAGAGESPIRNGGMTYITAATDGAAAGPAAPPKLRRFHSVAELDTMRIGRDAGRIAEEIVQHLSTLPAANVRVRIEIEADMPDGAPDNVVRTVSESCRTLKFVSQGFEEE